MTLLKWMYKSWIYADVQKLHEYQIIINAPSN